MIEVGEYVRTKKGKIFQYGKGRAYLGKDNEIVKHSKNLIDLIEVGDIVHTRDVLNEDIVYIWSEEYLKALKEDLKNGIELVDILTKERYQANCYTVERKEQC